jgi:hypothetical protein
VPLKATELLTPQDGKLFGPHKDQNSLLGRILGRTGETGAYALTARLAGSDTSLFPQATSLEALLGLLLMS